MHVVQSQLSVYTTGMHGVMPEIEQTLIKDAKENIERHKAVIQKSNKLVVDAHEEIGNVAICVSSYVLNNQKELVLMNT